MKCVYSDGFTSFNTKSYSVSLDSILGTWYITNNHSKKEYIFTSQFLNNISEMISDIVISYPEKLSEKEFDIHMGKIFNLLIFI